MAEKPIGSLAGSAEPRMQRERPRVPVLEQTNAEIEAGRRALARHADRERMLAAKRDRDEDEGVASERAKAANKDL